MGSKNKADHVFRQKVGCHCLLNGPSVLFRAGREMDPFQLPLRRIPKPMAMLAGNGVLTGNSQLEMAAPRQGCPWLVRDTGCTPASPSNSHLL